MTTIPFPFSRVGITGGTGTVAGVLQHVLARQYPEVERIVVSCRDPGGPRGHRLVASPKLEVLEGSIQDPGLLRRLVRAGEVVFHLAAWLANTAMPEDPNAIYIPNSLATAVICRLCASERRRLVFTSSHSVYFAGAYRGRISEQGFAMRQDFLDWIEAVKDAYLDLADAMLASGENLAQAAPALEAIHARFPPPMQPLIYDREEYHLYCLSKLLAERLVLDHGGVVLRLANVYGPGDESLQAVGEACHRVMHADPGTRLAINQPFKKLVPAYLGDIVNALLGAARLRPRGTEPRVFTVASQDTYLREDALLRAAARCLQRIRGAELACDIEALPPEKERAFTYDLGRMRRFLLPGEELTPLERGLEAQLRWRLRRASGAPDDRAPLTVARARQTMASS